jgi:hypothetical protein
MSEEQMAGLYASLTLAADLEQAVRVLTSRSLRELNGWLAREGCMNGVPALIHGLILLEASERFMKMVDSNEGGVA